MEKKQQWWWWWWHSNNDDDDDYNIVYIPVNHIQFFSQQYIRTNWFGLVWFDLICLIIVATYGNSPTTTWQHTNQFIKQYNQSVHILLLLYFEIV